MELTVGKVAEKDHADDGASERNASQSDRVVTLVEGFGAIDPSEHCVESSGGGLQQRMNEKATYVWLRFLSHHWRNLNRFVSDLSQVLQVQSLACGWITRTV